jgi:subtilisin family serine protease
MAGAAAVLLVLLSSAVPAHAAATSVRRAAGCTEPTGVYTTDIPWPQRFLDPTRVWSITTGRNVTVAVLGTGVDASNPQFAEGQVVAGPDLINTGKPTTTDCDGRGTFAAGIIAAHENQATTFAGVAPNATILSIRLTQTTDQGAKAPDPAVLANAIKAATAAKVEVICVLTPSIVDSPALTDAVAAAAAADIVVVVPIALTEFSTKNGTAYPAPDENVLAVAPIGPDGQPSSNVIGTYVDLGAPGKSLVGLGAGSGAKPGHVWPVDDPAFAAAYVAGVVALVRAHRPGLTASQVRSRVTLTASRGPGGALDPRVGRGIVNPYGAISAEGIDTSATPEPPPAAYVAGAVAEPVDTQRAVIAASIALGGLALAGVAVVVLAVVRRGRARHWRPGLKD